ncbi:AAA family ATPase [Halioglobus sp. Uisw_031]|uniref:AAA family ATPase n=1 Tax=Halioglobus sp. Uisw_031 TaxID=3230977 RepID=UPI0039ED950A
MKITELSLTNFRSFKETQKIEFAPVTLLFGPNSVGKSSVLLALFYLQQILEKGQCDPVRIEALGDKHIGGFKNLVNGRDLGKEMVIKVSFSTADDIGATYNDIEDIVSDDSLELYALNSDSPAAEANSVSLEFRLGWSDSEKTAFVSRYTVWLDEELVAEATSDPGLKQPMISYINYEHPLVVDENGEDDFASHFHRLITEPRMANEAFEVYDVDSVASRDKAFYHVPIGFRGRAGALPLLGRRLSTSLNLNSEIDNWRVEEILSDVLVAPLDNLLEFLAESLCIGPLRIVPDDMYQADPYPQQKDWYTGKAAWDAMRSTDYLMNKKINHWLSDKDTLNMGYKLVYEVEQGESRYISLPTGALEADDFVALSDMVDVGKLEITFSTEDLDVNPEAEETPVSTDAFMSAMSVISSASETTSGLYLDKADFKRKHIALWDIGNNLAVSASEIGVGVSQLMPLVVAANTRQKGLVACEQPELHVHPRVQVAIGDLLTQIENGPSFLIETHSEHLILRILRRIRETGDGDLPDEIKAVSPADISIVHMDSSENGVRVHRIGIDEDGEFSKKWPDGFFAERSKELF